MSKKPRVSHYSIPTAKSQEQRIYEELYMLELDGITSVFKELAKNALEKHVTYQDFLESLLEAQIISKEEIRVTSQITQAKFPFEATLESYNFSLSNKIDEAKVRELISCRFIDDGENIIFLGPTGVGKTHIAIALCNKATDYGKKFKFFKLNDFIEKIEKNTSNEVTQQRNLLKSLINTDLLVLDDMEYCQLSLAASDFLYWLMLGRYEKKVSTIFTSNEEFSNWGNLFGSNIRAEKIFDRVRERSHKIIIEGDSQRVRDKLDRMNKATK